MSRLLFAAARGARIGYETTNGWRHEYRIDAVQRNPTHYAIHPEDEHLQYGPVSTALRGFAERGMYAAAKLPYIEGRFVFDAGESWKFTTDEEHRSLFLLILAEALADEGL